MKRFLIFVLVFVLASIVTTAAVAQESPDEALVRLVEEALRPNNWAVGSWFGRAVPIDPFCEPGTVGCPVPPEVIMTPTFFADGVFMGSDSLAFGAPRTAAHGQWIVTGDHQILATMVLLQGSPEGDAFVGAFRTRFTGEIVDRNRLEGFVDVYFFPFVDENGAAIIDPDTGFPIPDPLQSLGDVITNPAECLPPVNGCLAVLEYVVRRITPRLDR